MALRAFQTVVIFVSLLALGVFAASATRVLHDRRSPDPVEHAVIALAGRFAHHQPLYVDPGNETAPSMLPGFPIAVATVAADGSPGLLDARVTALAAALFAALLCPLIVQLECGSWPLAVEAACFALI